MPERASCSANMRSAELSSAFVVPAQPDTCRLQVERRPLGACIAGLPRPADAFGGVVGDLSVLPVAKRCAGETRQPVALAARVAELTREVERLLRVLTRRLAAPER